MILILFFYCLLRDFIYFPVAIYLLKSTMETQKAMCKIHQKLTIKALGRSHSHNSGVFLVNFEQILQIDLVFPLSTLNK